MSTDYKIIFQNAGITSCIFLLTSLPQMYIKTNELLDEQGNCPTYKSKLLHTLIFCVLVALAIKYLAQSDKSLGELFEYSFKASLLYFFISSTEMYTLTNVIANESVVIAEDGCPTLYGVLIHTVLFGLLLVVCNFQ